MTTVPSFFVYDFTCTDFFADVEGGVFFAVVLDRRGEEEWLEDLAASGEAATKASKKVARSTAMRCFIVGTIVSLPVGTIFPVREKWFSVSLW